MKSNLDSSVEGALGDNQVAGATKGALVAHWEPNEYLPEKQLDTCQRLTAGRGQCD